MVGAGLPVCRNVNGDTLMSNQCGMKRDELGYRWDIPTEFYGVLDSKLWTSPRLLVTDSAK